MREQRAKTIDTRERQDKRLKIQEIQESRDDPRETSQVNMGRDKLRRDEESEEDDK